MDSLENQLLIAMPTLGDPYFNKTVTYICEHNDEGAMGLIINLPVNISLSELLAQLEEEKVMFLDDFSINYMKLEAARSGARCLRRRRARRGPPCTNVAS